MKNKLIIYKYALIIALMLISNRVCAGELQLGLAALNSHSAVKEKPAESKLLPAIIYQGENFSFIYNTLAYRFFSPDNFSIALTGQLRQKTYEPKDSVALNGMVKRDNSFDMGINIQSDYAWGTLELDVLHDVSSTYEGHEVKASYAYPWMKGRWLLKPEVGVSYLNQRLVGYYYGVNINEQRVDRPAFSAEAAINSFVKISVFYRLSKKWNVIAGLEYSYLEDAITKSPIVDENYETTAFSAITYTY